MCMCVFFLIDEECSVVWLFDAGFCHLFSTDCFVKLSVQGYILWWEKGANCSNVSINEQKILLLLCGGSSSLLYNDDFDVLN